MPCDPCETYGGRSHQPCGHITCVCGGCAYGEALMFIPAGAMVAPAMRETAQARANLLQAKDYFRTPGRSTRRPAPDPIWWH